MAPRAVIDTNVFISSAWGGKPKKVIDLWKQGKIILCLSEEILQEYLEVIARGHASQEICRELVSLFQSSPYIDFVIPSHRYSVIKEDPADNKFLDCAVAGKARWIVSGDFHLHGLRTFMGVRILSPSEFLREYHQSVPGEDS